MKMTQQRRETDDFDLDTVIAFDIETWQPTGDGEQGFMKWPYHRPILSSLLTAQRQENGAYAFSMDTIICTPGEEATFFDKLEERLPEYGTTVSFNGRGFDAAVLSITAIEARRFSTPRLSRVFRANRYGRIHCDLAEQFSTYRAATTPSLAEICHRLQIPIKTSVDGAGVAELYASGQIERIADYCTEDALATMAAFWMWMAFRNSDDAIAADPLAGLARWIEREPELQHLRAFADCPPARWAKQRTLELSVQRAADAAESRIQRFSLEQEFSRNVIDF